MPPGELILATVAHLHATCAKVKCSNMQPDRGWLSPLKCWNHEIPLEGRERRQDVNFLLCIAYHESLFMQQDNQSPQIPSNQMSHLNPQKSQYRFHC